MPRRGWLNRNVMGMTVTSFFGDLGYEMVTAVLPGFVTSIGVAALALGWIEGAADALSSFVKLGAGWYSDRIGHRKRIVAAGYFLSGTALGFWISDCSRCCPSLALSAVPHNFSDFADPGAGFGGVHRAAGDGGAAGARPRAPLLGRATRRARPA